MAELKLYTVAIDKAYYPKDKWNTDFEFDVIQWMGRVKARSRTEAAKKGWDEFKGRWSKDMLPPNRLGRKVSLYVDEPGDPSQGLLTRLMPVRVAGITDMEWWHQEEIPDDVGEQYNINNGDIMNKKAVANELVKIAKIISSSTEYERELRIMTMDDVMKNATILDLKLVFKGTVEEINTHAEKKLHLEWKNAPKQMFGGYFYDKKTSNAYLIT